MYHITNIKNWWHHIHLPSHEAVAKLEHFFLDKRFWAIMGLIALIAFITLMLYLGLRFGTPSKTPYHFYSGPYPIPM